MAAASSTASSAPAGWSLLPAARSLFARFNRYRITQQYRCEQGELLEVVELFKQQGTGQTPFPGVEARVPGQYIAIDSLRR